MSTPSASNELEPEVLPPSRFILDLDEPLQLQALLECLDLLAHPPLSLEKPGPERQWRSRVWVRLSYLLMHSSLTRSTSQRDDLQVLAKHHQSLAQRLLAQDEALTRLSIR
jgi:hypothetical protein